MVCVWCRPVGVVVGVGIGGEGSVEAGARGAVGEENHGLQGGGRGGVEGVVRR